MKRKIYPRVTFIIPALNEEFNLPRCLSSIRSQNYPQNHIEIIIADGGSIDKTRQIAKEYDAKVIQNPYILHEQGKSLAAKIAQGDIFFFTDADNVLSHDRWLQLMTKPWLDNKKILGFLPQTIAAPDSNGIDRYLGHLFTDPFTWFVYGFRANPKDYYRVFDIIVEKDGYKIFNFSKGDFPLFRLSQGVGTSKTFKRDKESFADDLLSGIKIIQEHGLIAYVPNAGVYHYHVSGFKNFIRKYQWRIRNNLKQQVRGMGIVNRIQYFSYWRKIRMYIFVPYGLSILFPFIDACRLALANKDFVMFLHVPISFVLAGTILIETLRHIFVRSSPLGTYE